MRVQGIKKYRTPNYPDKKMIMKNPMLLRSVPERWKGNRYVSAALSTLLLFTVTACGRGEQAYNTPMEKIAAVAPIFEHGEGRGSFGCMSVAPPSFLSEEEAFQVICEEAGKMGIAFEKDGKELSKVELPETKYYLKGDAEQDSKQDGGKIDSTKTGELKLDGYDASRKIGFEFISREDYEAWSIEQGIRSSVDDFDFLTTAEVLRAGLEGKTSDSTIGILYNTMVKPDRDEINKLMNNGSWEEAEEKLKNTAKDELRNQVKDFLEWLKAQGVI